MVRLKYVMNSRFTRNSVFSVVRNFSSALRAYQSSISLAFEIASFARLLFGRELFVKFLV